MPVRVGADVVPLHHVAAVANEDTPGGEIGDDVAVGGRRTADDVARPAQDGTPNWPMWKSDGDGAGDVDAEVVADERLPPFV